MKIQAKVVKTFDTGNVKAVCDIMFEDAFVVHGVRFIRGQKGDFVAMPSDKWKNTQGDIRHIDIAHPLDTETRVQIFKAVSDAYDAHVQSNGINEIPTA